MACSNGLFGGNCCTWIIVLLLVLVLFGGDLLNCNNGVDTASSSCGCGCGC